jgi:hypothetical protein
MIRTQKEGTEKESTKWRKNSMDIDQHPEHGLKTH